MNGLKRAVLMGWVAAGAMCFATAGAEDTVTLKVGYPEGETVYYKFSYTLDYQSDHPELIDPTTTGRGISRLMEYGEWISGERNTPAGEDDEPLAENQVQVVAKMEKAESQPIVSGARLSIERFPHTLENFKGREFKWRVTGGDSVSDFTADFASYAISRPDLVTDIQQIWLPEMCPILPGRPVAKGDKWTGSRSFRIDYPSLDDDAIFSFDSEYKLKKIEEKDGRKLAILEEKRKVKYQRWLYMNPVSIVVEGEGEAKGEWEVDVDRGLIKKHEMQIKLKRPAVRTAGEKDNHDIVKASMSIRIKTELERVGEED
jgi:hypothetical protein